LDPRLPTAAAAVLAVLGVLFPPAVIFVGVGIPLGLLGGEIAGPKDYLLGFVPGLLLGGLVAVVVHRQVAAILSSAVGAWLLVIGALAALHQFGGLVTAMASQPWGVIIAAGLFALAGSVYQIAVRPSPEEAERQAAERQKLQQRKAEQKALEKRWGA
jgi:cytochrome c oxidase assembly factor CtaG